MRHVLATCGLVLLLVGAAAPPRISAAPGVTTSMPEGAMTAAEQLCRTLGHVTHLLVTARDQGTPLPLILGGLRQAMNTPTLAESTRQKLLVHLRKMAHAIYQDHQRTLTPGGAQQYVEGACLAYQGDAP